MTCNRRESMGRAVRHEGPPVTEFALQRKNMVDSQVRPSDIADRRLLRVLAEVPREAFVPASQRTLAYMDGPLMLDAGAPGEARRTLLAPRVFAKLVDLATIGPTDLVLDVGCAMGYSSAVLAGLARAVVALESDAMLAAEARARLAARALDVAVVTGELAHGHPNGAPYDAIVLEGGVAEVPAALLDQLADGGRLVAVVTNDGQGRATLWRRAGEVIGRAQAFDAPAPALPGFSKPAAFSL